MSLPAPDAVDLIAADQLAKHRGMSSDQALREILLQDALLPVVADAKRTAGRSWTGSGFDLDNGGALVLYGTDPDSLRTFVSSLPEAKQSFVSVKQVTYSLGDLQAIQASVNEDLALAGASVADTMIDQVGDTVVVDTLPAGELASSDSGSNLAPSASDQADRTTRALASIRERFPETVKLAVAEGQPTTFGCSGIAMLCDEPLRGGNAMAHVTSSGENGATSCATGFYVRSNIDQSPMMMTAGHCSSALSHWQTIMPKDGAWHWIGYSHYVHDGPEGDVELISIDNPAGWDPQHIVRTAYPFSDNPTYPITGIGYSSDIPPTDTYLCPSNVVVWGTHCGPFAGGGISANGVNNLGKITDTRGCVGESGGPIFKRGQAYGILEGGPGTWDGTYIFNGLMFQKTICSSTIWYQGMSGALNLTNSHLITTNPG